MVLVCFPVSGGWVLLGRDPSDGKVRTLGWPVASIVIHEGSLE